MLMDDGNEVVKCNSRSITAEAFAVAPCHRTGLAVEVRCQAAISNIRLCSRELSDRPQSPWKNTQSGVNGHEATR